MQIIQKQLLFPVLFLILSQALHAHDLSLGVALEKSQGRVGDTINCIVQLKNDGGSDIENAQISLTQSAGMKILHHSASKGNYDKVGGKWDVLSIKARESKFVLTMRCVLVQTGPQAITGEITYCSVPDTDSTPNNSDPAEDDISYGTITVPIVICGNQPISITASAIPGYSKYEWKKENTVLPSETSATLHITEPGTYTYEVAGDRSFSAFSAPIIVERGDYPIITLPEVIDIPKGKEIFVTPTINGGLKPYRYQWSNDIGWDMKQRLKLGQTMHLKLKITDRRGCIATDIVTINALK